MMIEKSSSFVFQMIKNNKTEFHCSLGVDLVDNALQRKLEHGKHRTFLSIGIRDLVARKLDQLPGIYYNYLHDYHKLHRFNSKKIKKSRNQDRDLFLTAE